MSTGTLGVDIHRLPIGRSVKLSGIPTKGASFHGDRKVAEKEFRKLRRELRDLQYRLYAEGKQKLLIVLQALDTGGKDSTIRRVFQGVNPQGVRVHSFKAPTAEELAHDYLWRVHKVVPAAGMIGIFNRSHYEDVLVVRVDNIVPESIWRPRYEHINNFEKMLSDTGTKILKFYLHISAEEQRERLQERLDDPSKNWKFDVGDLAKRKQWSAYRTAYEEALSETNTPYAPWYVIPADQKWYRNLAISSIITHTLYQMNPQLPPVTEDLSSIVIE